MKGFIAVCLVLCVILFGMVAIAETRTDIFYEDVISGEYVLEHVYIKAKRARRNSARWSVESESGDFLEVAGSEGWVIKEGALTDCDEATHEAFNSGEPVKLRIVLFSDGDANITKVYPYDHTTLSGAIGMLGDSMPILLVGGIVVAVAFAVLAMSGPTKTYRQEPPRENRHERTIVSVRIMDSTGPAYGSRTSTASAVGRAVVGDMLAGPTGAFIGAATAKQKPVKVNDGTMTFRITWSDGSQTTETVTKGSYMYRKLIDMVP